MNVDMLIVVGCLSCAVVGFASGWIYGRRSMADRCEIEGCESIALLYGDTGRNLCRRHCMIEDMRAVRVNVTELRKQRNPRRFPTN